MDKDQEIEMLRRELEEARQNTTKAAEFGKFLLEENEDLKDRMENLSKATDKKLELAEQEKHSLQVKFDQKSSIETWYNEEIGHLKQQLKDSQTDIRELLEAEKAQEVSRLNRQIDELRTDLDVANSREQQMNDKNRELEELLQERLNQTEVSSRSFGASEELCVLQEEVNALQSTVTSLKSELIEKRTELQRCEHELEAVKYKVVARDEELVELKCHVTSLSNNIEEGRMEKLDLNCQLDALRMEASGHRKKGNSIFSELDDRRIDAEKKLVSLKVMNDTLKEKYQVEKQQNQKYKRQISQLLLELSTGRVDTEYVTNLESKLSQARQEVRVLIEEKTELQDKKLSEARMMTEVEGGKEKDGDYVQYLVTLIDGKEQELQKLRQDLSQKTIQLLDEKSRTSSQECKLKQLETEKDKLRSQGMKLSLKVEELLLKYEPDSVKKSGALVVKRTEKIPIDEPNRVTITETRRVGNTTSQMLDTSTVTTGRVDIGQEPVEQSKTLSEHSDNNTLSVPLSSLIKKKKTVSISDEVQEHKMEQDDQDTENTEDTGAAHLRHKSKRITAVKHISADSCKKVKDVNDCKSQ